MSRTTSDGTVIGIRAHRIGSAQSSGTAVERGKTVRRHLVRALPTVGFVVLIAAGLAPAAAAQGAAPVAATAAVSSTQGPDDGHDSMPGMDMPETEMPATDEPHHEAPAENMPGMNMPATDMPAEGGHPDPVSRPRGAVLGTFAGVNAAILVSALALRHRSKDEKHPKRGPRATAPTLA